MESKFIPKADALKNTDWRKPEVDKKDVKKLVLLGLAVAMLAVVFIPWFCLGVKAGDIGAVKLRAFGFQTWYGILAGVLALVAVVGALYKHYSLTLCSAVIAVLLGFYAVNQYPDCRLSVSVSDMALEYGGEEVAMAMEIYDDLPNIKIPGKLIEAAELLVDFVDQKFLYDLLDKVGVYDQIEEEIGGFKILNHRLGAVLYIIFSFLAAVLSYIMIAGCNCCFKKKEACPAPAPAPTAEETSETTVVNE